MATKQRKSAGKIQFRENVENVTANEIKVVFGSCENAGYPIGLPIGVPYLCRI